LPGSTEAAARRAYHDLLRRCFDCVTDAQIVETRHVDGRRVLHLDSGPLRAPRLAHGISLRMTEWYWVRPDQHHLVRRDEWRAVVDAYRYAVHDADGRELLAWRWLPVDPAEPPHLYVRGPLAEVALPTGAVQVHSVLRLLLAEFGVPPRRTDWKIVLDEAELDLAELSRCTPALGAARPGFPPRWAPGIRPDART
jgi:hypothetical protein